MIRRQERQIVQSRRSCTKRTRRPTVRRTPRPQPTRDPEIAYTGLTDIHLKTWTALRMNGMAARSDWSRTDSPGLVSGPNLLISRTPLRFSDQDGEQSPNYTNLEEAISR